MIILGEKLPDLPVVDVDNVTLPYSAASLPPNQETFVRPIGIEQNNRAFRGGLSKLLEMADCMFEEAADECGATVVDHEWQLARAVRHDVRVHKLLPAGYSLVARVGIIDDVGFDEPTQSRIKEGLDRYASKANSYRWSDAKIRQFTRGSRRGRPEAGVQTWLHDIDIYMNIPRKNLVI